jgi:hypothetical protein
VWLQKTLFCKVVARKRLFIIFHTTKDKCCPWFFYPTTRGSEVSMSGVGHPRLGPEASGQRVRLDLIQTFAHPGRLTDFARSAGQFVLHNQWNIRTNTDWPGLVADFTTATNDNEEGLAQPVKDSEQCVEAMVRQPGPAADNIRTFVVSSAERASVASPITPVHMPEGTLHHLMGFARLWEMNGDQQILGEGTNRLRQTVVIGTRGTGLRTTPPREDYRGTLAEAVTLTASLADRPVLSVVPVQADTGVHDAHEMAGFRLLDDRGGYAIYASPKGISSH